MKLVFATNNPNKVKEIKALLGESFEILSLSDIGCTEEIPETQNTLEGNALQKARYIKEKYGYNCFADDTGLLVEALNGEPGVYSARYAGEQKNAKDNIQKLLQKLADENNRKAYFQTSIALILDSEETLFNGVVNGEITHQESGAEGFGYDPVFQPEGKNTTFAEMSLQEKNKISHRGRAFAKMIAYLENKK